jgi:hypothetical protein
MKEITIKEMMNDSDIPDSYKLGGRLDERFLAGVEYAEQKIREQINSSRGVWMVRQPQPLRNPIDMFEYEPKQDEHDGYWSDGSAGLGILNSSHPIFSEVGDEPKKFYLVTLD